MPSNNYNRTLSLSVLLQPKRKKSWLKNQSYLHRSINFKNA